MTNIAAAGPVSLDLSKSTPHFEPILVNEISPRMLAYWLLKKLGVSVKGKIVLAR